jgi:hypothetical protein
MIRVDFSLDVSVLAMVETLPYDSPMLAQMRIS